MTPPDSFETAIHEAGHAVVGWLTGRAISRVTIRSEGRIAGETVFLGSCNREHPIVRAVLPSAHLALQVLAGPLAEHLYGGGSSPLGSDKEAAEALDVYRRSGAVDRETLYRATDAVLNERDVREAVFDVAEAILRKRAVTGDGLHALLARRFGDGWRNKHSFDLTMLHGARGQRGPVE